MSAIAFFVGVGGLGFLFSTLVRGDWLWLLGSYALTGVISEWVRVKAPLLVPLLILLPPLKELESVGNLMLGQAFSMMDVAWVMAYGFAAFCTGLLVLRKRSIAT